MNISFNLISKIHRIHSVLVAETLTLTLTLRHSTVLLSSLKKNIFSAKLLREHYLVCKHNFPKNIFLYFPDMHTYCQFFGNIWVRTKWMSPNIDSTIFRGSHRRCSRDVTSLQKEEVVHCDKGALYDKNTSLKAV